MYRFNFSHHPSNACLVRETVINIHTKRVNDPLLGITVGKIYSPQSMMRGGAGDSAHVCVCVFVNRAQMVMEYL